MKFKRYAAVILMVVGALLLGSCGYSTPSDMVAVHVGEGPIEASKVKGCKPASDRGFWTNDTYALFPTSEREWDATGQDGSDSGRFKAVTRDSVEMYIPVTVRFTLITECDTLTDFYTRYARRYGVEFDSDGGYNQEWITLLRKLVADPADATLDRIVQGYNWRDMWADPATKVEVEKAFNDALSGNNSLMDVTAKGHFFEGVSVLIGAPQPANEELAVAVAAEQTKVAQAQSEEAQADADAAKAEAQLAVSRAEAAKKRAEIDGYGGVENYLKALCIENGCNPFQPTYLYGGTR
jgi:hypothetical protein